MSTRRTSCFVSLMLAPFVLLACGSQERPAEEAPQTAAPATGQVAPSPSVDVCAMISVEEVLTATGIEAPSGVASTSGIAKVCTWADATGRAAVVQVFPSGAGFEEARVAFESLYQDQAESIADLGEAAFYIGGTTGQIPTATIGARQGSGVVTVQVMGMGLEPAALRQAADALTRAFLGQMGGR